MTSINMPPDDAALKVRPPSSDERTVKPAEAYPVITPVKQHEEGQKTPRALHPRPPRRRQGERRQRDEPVLLDTRAGEDRRREEKRDDADTPPHIDDYA